MALNFRRTVDDECVHLEKPWKQLKRISADALYGSVECRQCWFSNNTLCIPSPIVLWKFGSTDIRLPHIELELAPGPPFQQRKHLATTSRESRCGWKSLHEIQWRPWLRTPLSQLSHYFYFWRDGICSRELVLQNLCLLKRRIIDRIQTGFYMLYICGYHKRTLFYQLILTGFLALDSAQSGLAGQYRPWTLLWYTLALRYLAPVLGWCILEYPGSFAF